MDSEQPPSLPDDLLAGTRTLEDIPGFTLSGSWHREGSAFLSACSVTVTAGSEFVDATTHWIIAVSESYPAGAVVVYRAENSGVRGDLPHELPGNVPCLINRAQTLGRWDEDPEPEDAFSRLAWHAARLVQWIEKAAQGTLLKPGDPFGHPWLHQLEKTQSINTLEDPDSLEVWRPHFGQHGEVQLLCDSRGHLAQYATEFTRTGRVILKPQWGTWVTSLNERRRGTWLLLGRAPFIDPWGFPATWSELRERLHEQGINLDQAVRQAICRKQETAPVFMVGYPVPDTMGGPDVKIEWQACKLPSSAQLGNRSRGFRNAPKSWWLRARWEHMRGDQKITWTNSSNHQPAELGSRGFLSEEVRTRRFFLIGAGALGSAIAEHLVRTGVTQISVIDNDSIQTRNLVRHTLTLGDVPAPKASALAKRLGTITTLVQPTGYDERFPPRSDAASKALQDADVIIDTTGSEPVLDDLGQICWPSPRIVFSLSMGWRAETLYAYAEKTERFNTWACRRHLGPHVGHDLALKAGEPAPLDGIGCWDPVWPGLHTDVQLLAAAGAKFICDFVQADQQQQLKVFEQMRDASGFAGFRVRAGDPT